MSSGVPGQIGSAGPNSVRPGPVPLGPTDADLKVSATLPTRVSQASQSPVLHEWVDELMIQKPKSAHHPAFALNLPRRWSDVPAACADGGCETQEFPPIQPDKTPHAGHAPCVANHAGFGYRDGLTGGSPQAAGNRFQAHRCTEEPGARPTSPACRRQSPSGLLRQVGIIG